MESNENTLLTNSVRDRALRFFQTFRTPATATFFGLLVGGMVITWSGGNGLEGVRQLIIGGYGSVYYLTTTLTRATPIIFAGLASALSWGSGYETMGISGQMTLGAFVSAVVAVNVTGPVWLVMLSAILAGVITGMAYSMIAAWISLKFNAYLLIVTLMMNYLAENIASYFTNYVFKDPLAVDNLAIQTQKIENGILPRLLQGYTLHFGFIIALLCVFAILFITKKTSFGYEAGMNGMNFRFSLYGGVNSKRTMYRILMLSGGIAGLGGAVEVLGSRYRFIDKMITSPGYAWNGITASLMSSNHPIGILFSSIFLSGLTTGGAAVERNLQIPQEITSIIQGVLTIFVTAQFIFKFRKNGKGQVGKKLRREGM